MPLSRDDILALSDISVKKITVPDSIPVWGGKELYIKQLTRGQQDMYLRKQFGTTKMKQDVKNKQQEISLDGLFGGLDSWLCCVGICDENGKQLFTDADIEKLNKKSGEPIGWIAGEIVAYSGMENDDKVAKGEMSLEGALAEEIKNS